MMQVVTSTKYTFKSGISTTPSGYSQLANFYRSCSNVAVGSCIELDFSDLEWFDANLCAVLASIIYKLGKERGIIFFADYKGISQKFNVLHRNGFISTLNGESFYDHKQSAVPLNQFSQNDDEGFIKYVENDLFEHPALLRSKARVNFNPLITHFLELFTNIQLHAATEDPVFACGQYYPNTQELKFTIVDLGVGFLTPIQKFTKGVIQTPLEAVKWALRDRNTVKTDAPGGFGLKDLLNYCTEHNREFSIITGNTFWGNQWSTGQLGPRVVPEYCGSIVNITFAC